MDLARLDFIKQVRDVELTADALTINRRDGKVETIKFDEPPTRINNVELDLVNVHSRVVITGGESGHAVHVHYKDSVRIDCQLFLNKETVSQLHQGVLT